MNASRMVDSLRVKIIVSGNEKVGKTSIILRYGGKSFSEEEENFDRKYKHVVVDHHDVEVAIVDTHTDLLSRSQDNGVDYRDADAIVICYSVTDTESFSDVPRWLDEAQRYTRNQNLLVVVLANKCDLPNHTVTQDEGKAFASKNGLRIFETSAKDDIGIDEAFQYVVDEIINIRYGLKKAMGKRGCGCGCVLL